MLEITIKEVSFVLIGIFLFNLYFDTRFTAFIFISFLFFLIPIMKIFAPFESKYQSLITAVCFIAVGVYGLVEGDKFKKRGIGIFEPASKKNIIVGFILVTIYVLLKILYFEKS